MRSSGDLGCSVTSMHADDTGQLLNQYLEQVTGWIRANEFRLNPDKIEVQLQVGSGLILGRDCILRLAGMEPSPKAWAQKAGIEMLVFFITYLFVCLFIISVYSPLFSPYLGVQGR